MSKIASFKTSLREGEFISAALKAMGYNVEVHVTAKPLNIYGDLSQRAEIIVRKEDLVRQYQKENHGGHCHLYGDLGFARQADGTFLCIHDDMDASYGIATEPFMNRLSRQYAEESKMAWAVQQGYVFAERADIETEQGRISQLLFYVR